MVMNSLSVDVFMLMTLVFVASESVLTDGSLCSDAVLTRRTCAEIPFSAQLKQESLPADRTNEIYPLIHLSGVRQHERIRAEVGSRRDSRTSAL